MILRVWALYGQSRFILGALLTLYAIEVVPNLVLCVKVSTQNKSIGVWTMTSYRARYNKMFSVPPII